MIKIAFFFIIIAIGYIQCNSINISNDTDLPTGLPTTYAEPIDIKENERMKFFALFNRSEIRTNQSNNKPNDMSGYYNWLHFLKSSTSTQVNNVTIPLKTI